MAIDEAFNDYILKERTFLHDISNQLVIAQGMGVFVLKTIQAQVSEKNLPESKELVRMEKTMKAINSMIEMIKSRREIVKAIQGIPPTP